MSLVVAAGADVNGKDKDGKTPLHLAAGAGSEATCRVLLEHGADGVDDHNGLGPLHYAAEKGQQEVAQRGS